MLSLCDVDNVINDDYFSQIIAESKLKTVMSSVLFISFL